MSVPRKIRVLRLLEYTYDSVEIMEQDMSRWGVPSLRYMPAAGVKIKSVVLPLETIEPEPAP